jgi:hypothetical protein
MEGHMLGKSMRIDAPETSFYYWMIAETCFQRIARSHHSKAGIAVRDIGRKYLAKVGGGVLHKQMSEIFVAEVGRVGAKKPRRLPWKVD